MKIMLALAVLFTLVTSAVTSAAPDQQELAVAHEIKMYIAREHRARKSDPAIDFAKIERICGRSQQWTKGCRVWKATSGKDKYYLQVRSTKKIYGIPSMLM